MDRFPIAGVALAWWIVCANAGRGDAQTPTAGYPTSLRLDAPLRAGASVRVTGTGAPQGPGVHVELWRVVHGSRRAVSVASTGTDGSGGFAFEGVEVRAGDAYHVTLSRSWNFESDGIAEGWDAAPSADAEILVGGDVLAIVVRDGDGDGFRQPWVFQEVAYDPDLYRVLEIRLRAMADGPRQPLGILWGAPWPETVGEHIAEVPSGSEDFQTILIPMNVGERRRTEGPPSALEDGLWADGSLHTALRIDPLPGIAEGDSTFDGAVFEIDSIRLREDYRFDFHDDAQGFSVTSDVEHLEVRDGALEYTVGDVGSYFAPAGDGVVDPALLVGLLTGAIETGHFDTLAIGYEASVAEYAYSDPIDGEPLWVFAAIFDDRDSVEFADDGGLGPAAVLQYALGAAPVAGRFDGFAAMDELTFDPLQGVPSPGEWTEDGAVPTSGLRLDIPERAAVGDQVEIDYVALIPASAHGPSLPVVAIAGGDTEAFIRGDCNGDGEVAGTVSDAVFMLAFSFLGGPEPPCLAACDANDDGEFSGLVTDAVFLLSFSFLGGPPPPAPFPDCGVPGAGRGLGCETAPVACR